MVKLYDKTGDMLIANLENCIECFVEEERNGIFELRLIYPTFDTNFNSLIKENIIVSNANDLLRNQKFRIYHISKEIANKVQIYARHISFDLMYDFIENIDIENQSCEYTLNTIFRNSQFSRHYRGYSDIFNAQDFKIEMIDCLSAIAGSKGSIIDTFGTGAEILRDNESIHILNRRGHDNSVTIEYGKNLTGFNCIEDTTDLITRIFPYAKYTPDGEEETIVKGIYVDSKFINNFSHPYIKHIDFSDKFEDSEVPTIEKLRNLSLKYFEENKCDIPKLNYKIEFIPLSKCIGYEGLEDKISLCDVVTVKHKIYKVDTQVKVIKTVFNVLKDRYESMELGEPKTSLGDIVGKGEDGEDGKIGPPGPQGPPGVDGKPGDLNDFPDTLPSVPNLASKVYGFANIELSWNFENKLYYNYELYASKVKDFTPNIFDLIFQGQASTFLHQVKPDETWYYRVRATNTHGRGTEFSSQIVVATKKVDDMENYFTSAAIGNAVVGSLNADYMQAGIIKGNWIDAKQLSVTDGNGKRTLDIDSFGNVSLDVTSLKISNKTVITEEDITNKINVVKEDIDNEINDVKDSITNIEDVTIPALEDNILTETEKEAIKSNLKALETEKADINSKYASLNLNANLSDEVRRSFKNSYDDYILKYNNLVDFINTLLLKTDITENDNSQLNSLFLNHNLALGTFSQSINIAIDNIAQNKANQAEGNSKKYVDAEIKTINGEISLKVSTDDIINQINLSKEAIKILANRIELNGATTIGDSENRHIKIDKANYSVWQGNKKVGYLGFQNDEKGGHPKLVLGWNGIDVTRDDYFTLHAYPTTTNPENHPRAYADLAFHCINFDDWSNIKMYGDGDIRIAPIKDLIITTNYKDGSYGGAGENRVAMFAGSASGYYNGNLQIHAVRNISNGYGLVLTDDHASNKCAVRVNVDANGNRFFRPLTTDGNVELGSASYKWKKVYSGGGVAYSVTDIDTARNITYVDSSIDSVIDTLDFDMNIFRSRANDSSDIQLNLNVANLKEHPLSNMFLNITEEYNEEIEAFESNTTADMTSLLHLALYELQKQKKEIEQLKNTQQGLVSKAKSFFYNKFSRFRKGAKNEE